ncbi:MAG TPA: DsbA family oxidoreductase [Ignavibacteriales bacterium]|nr:DsbA family oxidoreductase [Ignavibacteriales bacterium]
MNNNKLKVEVWSDVVCPFCYMGKRKFELALEEFPHKDQVEVEWKSFLLNPDAKTDTSTNVYDHLARVKGWNAEKAREVNRQVTEAAAQVGLEYNFDKAVVANTMKAHGFLQFAKEHGAQNEAEEKLFRAYFTEGRNIDDTPTLVEIGNEMELDTTTLARALEDGTYTESVRKDLYEARQFDIRSVPFFLFDGKLGVIGAQPQEYFLQVLEKVYSGWQRHNAGPDGAAEGSSCSIDGDC